MLFVKKVGDDSELKVVVHETQKSYDVVDLQKALDQASSKASKKKSQFTVSLPSGTIIIEKALNVPSYVLIKGKTGTEIILKGEGVLMTKSICSTIENLSLKLQNDSLILPSINVKSKGELKLKQCTITAENDDEGVIWVEGEISVEDCKLSGVRLESHSGKVNINKTSMKNEEELNSSAISISDSTSKHSFSEVEVDGFSSGLFFHNSAGDSIMKKCKIQTKSEAVVLSQSTLTLEDCNLSISEGICLVSEGYSSKLNLEGCSVDGKGSAAIGCQCLDSGNITTEKSEINNFKQKGALVSGSNSQLTLKSSTMSGNESGAILVENGGKVEGDVQLKNNGGTVVELSHGVCSFDLLTIIGGKRALYVHDSSFCFVNNFRSKLMEVIFAEFVDSAFQIQTANIVGPQNENKKPKINGFNILFTKAAPLENLLRDCTFNSCVTGVNISEVAGIAEKSELSDEVSSGVVTDMQNCSFLRNQVGLKVDRASVKVEGCSFISNYRRSLEFRNQFLVNTGQLRKEARLKLDWVNFIEPQLDDGSCVSNNKIMLEELIRAPAFRMVEKFETVLYLKVLTERIRFARGQFRFRLPGCVAKARLVMKSVHHVFKVLKEVVDKMVEQELIEDPNLGMFTATFQLDISKRGGTNTLIPMEKLMESWEKLVRTRDFDAALQCLNEAFERKQVDEDTYDEWVTPLEEMQRQVFVNSKFNRRRDYLFTLGRENPLMAWYFLKKENKKEQASKNLRKEVLTFFATDDQKHKLLNKSFFDSSWVAHWAVYELGKDLTNKTIPQQASLRIAWANKLLDDREPKTVIDAYTKNKSLHSLPSDKLVLFEAYKMMEIQAPLQYNQLRSLLSLFEYNDAVRCAARSFTGSGTLPGFLRRITETCLSAEEVLKALSPIYSDPMLVDQMRKKMIAVAVLSHFFAQDSNKEPVTVGQKERGYETCPSCFVQKLQPWNELKLAACKHHHLFCRGCIKESMSTGDRNLWGKCPGVLEDSDEGCPAIATRGEMEMSGMETDKIYNILTFQVEEKLRIIPGWKPCITENCVGGKGNVTKNYFHCVLCTNLVTKDGGSSDPTVAIKLLEGLDSNKTSGGAGVYRECYYCASPYEKGSGCSAVLCAHCGKEFSMTWGPKHVDHSFDQNGVVPQRYVPKVSGILWQTGVFKTKNGKLLTLGQTLTEPEIKEVLRRSLLLLKDLEA